MAEYIAASSAKLGVVLLAGFYYSRCLVVLLLAVQSDDRNTQLCGDSEWSWSLSSDCFRSGFLWPAVLLLAVSALLFALAWKLLPRNADRACSDGNQEKPVRRPLGRVVLIDNRTRVGAAVLTLSIAHAVVSTAWPLDAAKREGTSKSVNEVFYSTALARSSQLTTLACAVCFVRYIRSDRLLYAGLFPWALPALAGVQLLTGLIEIYFSFFTPEHAEEPFWGPDASARSLFLESTTLGSLVLVILYSLVHYRPALLRPDTDDSTTPYSLVADEADTAQDESIDNDTTPLAKKAGKKPTPLVDTPEINGSLLSRLTFAWFGDILNKGTNRQLDLPDVYDISQIEVPIYTWRRYRKYRKTSRSMLSALFKTFAPELAWQATGALVVCLIKFTSPFFLQRILRSIANLSQGTQVDSAHVDIRIAYLDAFGLLATSTLHCLLSTRVLWIGRCVGIRLKSLLVLEISSKTLQRTAVGEGKSGDGVENANSATNGKIVNLLTADFQRVTKTAAYLDVLYTAPLTLMVGVWYMYSLLGISALIGFILSAACYPLSRWLFAHLTKVSKNISYISDQRVSIITELLQGIKAVKLFGWEAAFINRVNEKREQQLKWLWSYWSVWIGVFPFSSFAPMTILFAVLAVYVLGFGNSLNAEIAFTAISVFKIVTTAFEIFPHYFNSTISAYISLRRIDSYLDQPEVQKLEERADVSAGHGSISSGDFALGFENASLAWGTAKDSSATSSEGPTKVSTPDAELSNGSQITEETPLLPSSSQVKTTLSASGSCTSLTSDEDMASFSLKNIDVRFPIGGLSIVAGPTGSGKSSLLSALIGEMSLVGGKVLLPTVNPALNIGFGDRYSDIIELSEEGLTIREVAYVAQEAWLRNATIRENILFGEPYHKERYEEVLRVCALKPDLRILAAGDQTEIGERGVTLSGGQKQRVSLARAVYSDRKILLIDDCLSAVDAHTAKHILVECLLNKSSLMQGRTCVLVTHHVSMCLPHAQYLVMLREGEVSLKGNPKELQALGLFSKVLAELESGGSKQEEDKKKDAKGKGTDAGAKDGAKADADAANEEDLSKSVNDTKSEDEYNLERLQKIAEEKGLDPTADLSALEGTLVEDEERESGIVKGSIWFGYFRACGNGLFWTATILCLFASQIIQVGQVYWIKHWVTAAKDSSSSSKVLQEHSNTYWLATYFLIGCTASSLHYLFLYVATTGSLRASRLFHECLLYTIVHAAPQFFDSTPTGRIINRFSRDMQTIDEAAIDKFTWWLTDIVSMLLIFVIIIAAMPTFVFVAIMIALYYFATARYYSATSRELKRLESNAMSPLLSLFGELILGVSSIRAFGFKKYYVKEALNRISAHNRPFYLVWAANRWLSVRVDLVGPFIAFVCALFALSNVSWLGAGMAGFVLSYALSFSDKMMWVIRSYSNNELNMNAVERISQYFKLEQEAPLESTPENRPPANWPANGNIEVENLVIEYKPGVPVLHDLSLSVRHGEKIGVVGRTGAGKSTLSLAFLRFIEAAKGRIVIDSVDISKIGLEDLRRNVTIIPQDPVLFNGTIRFNLDPFGEFSDELVWDALKRAHLVRERGSQATSATTSVHEGKSSINENALERMSGIFASLDAKIKENGQNLSLGQRQLVALARALVRRSRLIIMDEATASVDFDTDDRIQRTIRGPEFASSTLFCIAHRLRTIIDYDRVLVLDKGKIAEFDTPWNLLQKDEKDSIFKGMCRKSGEFDYLVEAARRAHSPIAG